jgi:predicted DNA helicase
MAESPAPPTPADEPATPETLLVRGLDDEGPGDIVGAFINEARIPPESIGDIEIDDGEATVAVTEHAADAVLEAMDDKPRIGRSDVVIERLDAAESMVRAYVQDFQRLVDLEREEEMRRHEQEIRTLSGEQREAEGRALLNMRGRDEGESLSGRIVKFLRAEKGAALPDLEISVGDLVMISRQDPLRGDNPTGTVTQVTGHSVSVAFDDRPPDFVTGTGLRLDLYVNDITYQRMEDALGQLPEADGPLARLRDIIVGETEPDTVGAADIDAWHNDRLNDSQRAAVSRAVASGDVQLIHGPPGTGKTTTAVEAIRQAVDRGDTVLATAASNTAVDTLLETLLRKGATAVRLGHPARVTPLLREHTLDAKLQESDAYQASRAKRDEAFDLLDQQDDLTYPSGRWRRGMTDEDIRENAEAGEGERGVSAERMQEMAEWLDLQDRADALFDEAERLEDEAIDAILDAVDVVCSTNATAGSDLLDGHTFDTLVIDEATQATEPSCLIPITHAERVFLVGDHRQLPPTIQNPQAAEEGLRRTLFERLAERHQEAVHLLRTQYRMHETIMAFASDHFYDGHLIADESVRAHTLADLGVAADALPEARRDVLAPEAPLVFVDTADADAEEERRTGSTSRANPFEAERVAQYAADYLEAGVAPTDIAVISPYDDQVDRIQSALAERDVGADVDLDALEVDTVDGFQGREKEVVLISLVRSNERGTIGFLEEDRRFNVALTRARRKVVVIGDSSTVGSTEVYRAFHDYAQDAGRVVAA